MKHVFSNDGKAALRAVMARRPLLAFDFDGTLAPLVPNPLDAAVPLSVTRRLAQLASLLPVAVITGRAVDDVSRRLDFNPWRVIGNHGAEGFPDLPNEVYYATMDAARHALAAHAAGVQAHGILVEDKAYSIALHYRMARDRDAALAFIRNLLAEVATPLTISYGKLVVNLMPPEAPHKGAALLRLVNELGRSAAVFVGDDDNDEAGFAAAGPHWLTIRIGNHAPGSAAMFFLDDHAQMAMLLQDMTDLLPDARG